MCAHDFYEGQARVDGAFCDYTIESKMKFLNRCYENGITNIEMESLCFVGLLNHAKIRCNIFYLMPYYCTILIIYSKLFCIAAVVCVTLVDRLNGDQVASNCHEIQEKPFKLVGLYIKNALKSGMK